MTHDYIFSYTYNVTTLDPSKDNFPSKSSNRFSFLKLPQLLNFIPHFSVLQIWIDLGERMLWKKRVKSFSTYTLGFA